MPAHPPSIPASASQAITHLAVGPVEHTRFPGFKSVCSALRGPGRAVGALGALVCRAPNSMRGLGVLPA